jgi:hypothetical protein
MKSLCMGWWLILVLFSSAVVSAGSRLWLLDALDQFIGEVVGVDDTTLHVLVETSAAVPTIIAFDADGAVGAEPVLFLTTNCTGNPYVFATEENPARRVVHAIERTQLYQTTADEPVVLAAQSQLDPVSGNCSSFSPLPFQAQAVVHVATLSFTPPLRIAEDPNLP